MGTEVIFWRPCRWEVLAFEPRPLAPKPVGVRGSPTRFWGCLVIKTGPRIRVPTLRSRTKTPLGHLVAGLLQTKLHHGKEAHCKLIGASA